MECKKTGKGEVINKQGSGKNRQNGSIKNKNKNRQGVKIDRQVAFRSTDKGQ
jgi:hypothetical protein